VDWKELRPQGFVSDYAGVIAAAAKPQLEQYCGEVEHATGTRILLLTLGSLQNEPLEDVARTIFEAWRKPGAPRDQRVLVLLVIGDRRHYAAIGSGLNPKVANGLSQRVFRQMRPALRRQDYTDALRAAAETVGMAAAEGAHVRLATRLARRNRGSLLEDVPWPAVIGGVLIVIVLIWVGSPAGYGGFGGRGLLPALFHRHPTRRSTWGSRGSGGFGGYDSGDAFGGFGGAGCNDW
jgi:uncharacterized protein